MLLQMQKPGGLNKKNIHLFSRLLAHGRLQKMHNADLKAILENIVATEFLFFNMDSMQWTYREFLRINLIDFVAASREEDHTCQTKKEDGAIQHALLEYLNKTPSNLEATLISLIKVGNKLSKAEQDQLFRAQQKIYS